MLENIYIKYISDEKFEIDPAQLKLVKILEEYLLKLNKQKKIRLSFIGAKSKESISGVYIHGGVGRGKSMIMDLFYNEVNISLKQKIHFHDFMFMFHNRLNNIQLSNSTQTDYIKTIAQNIAYKTKLLCVDEFEINNIADAMIVERLFKCLIDKQVFIIITSNRQPSELFLNGLQRERFLPFIRLIGKYMIIFHLNNSKDYRLHMLSVIKETYLFPLDNETDKLLTDIIYKLTGRYKFDCKDIRIDNNRDLHIKNYYGNTVIFTFDELCIAPLGIADYSAICKNFTTVIVKNIPQIDVDHNNEALRFITFIDCLYDWKVSLIFTAQVYIDDIYKGNKYEFEFKRTLSRLYEMQSKKYIDASL